MFKSSESLERQTKMIYIDPEEQKKTGRQSTTSYLFRRIKRMYLGIGLLCFTLFLLHWLLSDHSIRQYSKTQAFTSAFLHTKDRAIRRQDGFIMITPTLDRSDLLPNFISHYASQDNTSLKALILEWVDEKTLPDRRLIESLHTYPIPIFLIRPNTRSLNERFKPLKKIAQNSIIASNREAKRYEKEYFSKAVFSVDDDILIPLSDLEQAFNIFSHPFQTATRMVGFFARKGTPEGKYVTSYKPEYNMVLTKGAFLHHDWFYKYWDERYIDLREFVTKNSNCEDILMSYIYADEVGVAPMFYLSKYRDLGLVKGISTKPKHYDARSKCIQEFNNFFGKTTLLNTDIMIKNLSA